MKIKHSKYVRSSALAAFSAAVLLSSPLAFSGGYEKPSFFSAEWAPLGGAAASAVSGAESVYFNPAGLAAGDSTVYITGNFDPTWTKFNGPLAGTPSVDSNNSFVPAFGIFGSFKPTDKWGIGAGVYLAGGARAIFDNVSYTNVPTLFGQAANTAYANSSSTIQANLSIVEFALATAYEVMDGFRLGVEWRITHISATLGSYAYDPGAPFTSSAAASLTTLTIDGISGTAYNGFRVGAQYYPKESRWGLGAVWRTQVNFTGTGTINGATTVPLAGVTNSPLANSTATVSNAFPQAFDIGGHYDIVPSGLRAHLQYTYTNYSVNQTLAIVGTASPTGLPSGNLTGIDQGWNNESDVRLGLECFEVPNWVFRASYVWSSEVTPQDRARATFTPPGPGNTIGFGAGTKFMDNHLELNGAFEYGWSSATVGSGVTAAPDQASGVAGTYSAHDYAFYLGATYKI